MGESPASQPLHNLMTEITGVKSQWEALVGRISLAYSDAYSKHTGALNIVRKRRADAENTNREVMLFLFSVATIGFSGGTVGSLFAPWSKAVEKKIVEYAFREGVRGAASETTKKAVAAGMTKIFDKAWGSSGSDALDPAAPPPWEQYLEKKTKLDICFGLVNETLTSLIKLANQEQWAEAIGQEILDAWRKSCPLLTDAPKDADAPDRTVLARAAETLMWVAWCTARDWKWWKEQYDNMNILFVKDPNDVSDYDWADALRAVEYADELSPVRDRTIDLIGFKATITIPAKWVKHISDRASRRAFPSVIIDMRVLGPYVQWTNIVQDAMPAAVDVEKSLGKTIPAILSDFDSFKQVGSGLVDRVLPLKPYFKRPKP